MARNVDLPVSIGLCSILRLFWGGKETEDDGGHRLGRVDGLMCGFGRNIVLTSARLTCRRNYHGRNLDMGKGIAMIAPSQLPAHAAARAAGLTQLQEYESGLRDRVVIGRAVSTMGGYKS